MKTPICKISTWMIPNGQFPPTKIPTQNNSHKDNFHRKISTQDKLHPEYFHPGKFPLS